LTDQCVKSQLQPQQQHHHIEFWIPSDLPLEIAAIPLPVPQLLEIGRVPRFGWARDGEVAIWNQLLGAFERRQARDLPAPPDLDDNRWAVSGMGNLGDALRWAVLITAGVTSERWAFQLGAWQCGRGDVDAALETLGNCREDRAQALAGRLALRHRRDAGSALAHFQAIQSDAISLHPQVVYERDLALSAEGRGTLEERARWLDAVSALEDEWLVERRAHLLLDQGKSEAAQRLLKETRFSLVHQRYERTRLWRQIEKELGLDPVPWPSWLGEDDLAEFGAYREYPE
jgi:hypothetical protein